MEDFNFCSRTRIIFGKGRETEVGEHIKPFAKKVLVHYGGDYLEKNGTLDRIITSLKASGVEPVLFDGVVPNPRLSVVKKGIALCRKEGIEFVLAIGGGSAIDSSKAIALGVPYDGDVWDFYTGKAEPKTALKVGTILTIPGSGSEMSESSIITNEADDTKYGIDNQLIVPEFSILNPEMCFTIPPFFMSAGLADILSHQFERYFTPTKFCLFSDHLLEGAMQAVIALSPKILKDPQNYDYCAEFMWLATISHNGVLDAGRQSDWASHRIEHEISALYDITHGAGMAIIFPAWMKHVKTTDLDRFVRLGTRVFGVNPDGLGKEQIADLTIKAVEDFFASLNLKITLSEAEVPTDRFSEMADKALGRSETIGRFQKLAHDDIVAVLKLAV
ncbi:iron-containing alcohol dehydrogenase [uncultured Cohaesibacter sp.]|uniref:iron-containing alcohol dehydrogenase n=1 Tax=uncultured Cohaesibacter sp. TaxID=1002546 RepID=UPI0029C7806A|nr:iron-containing alcohol dehydrogenase [uncultured Cohaesibacter sp.]